MPTVVNRIDQTFLRLNQQNQKGFIAFITAGDPTIRDSKRILCELPKAGVDLIELGIPFSEPIADGPVIQQANKRALKHHTDIADVLTMVVDFRKINSKTPIILMGYCNSIYNYGIEKFCVDATVAGIDGILVVDLPPEENAKLLKAAALYNLYLIHLVAPTTNLSRLQKILNTTKGFIYYVSVNGSTGSTFIDEDSLRQRVNFLREQTSLPIAVGFGIKNSERTQLVQKYADAAVIGSAIVNKIAHLKPNDDLTDLLDFVYDLSAKHNRDNTENQAKEHHIDVVEG